MNDEIYKETDDLTINKTLTISEEISFLLEDSNKDNSLNNNPKLTILSLVNLTEEQPCSYCHDLLVELSTWDKKSDYLQKGIIRILICDVLHLPKLKIWEKLHIYDNRDETPKILFFNKDKALIDIVFGKVDLSYVEDNFL